MRVLLIEDNSRLAGFIAKGLAAAGFTTDALETGADAEAALGSIAYDAAVLDLGLPDMDGMKLLSDLRAQKNNVPILILTARDGVKDRVMGLNGGADDYLLKPFAMEELVARIRAIMRRPSDAVDSTMTIGNAMLNVSTREFCVDQAAIVLSRREFDLMELLMRRSGRVISKAMIDEKIYGFGEEVSSNSVEVIVSRLRKRLRTADAHIQIMTFRGVGYMLQESGL